VMVADRSRVASSFTILKGSLIEESYSFLATWDEQATREQNIGRWKEANPTGAKTLTWLRDVGFVMSRRFDPAGRDRPLQILAAGGTPMEEWKPILLWHITRDEFILRDFLTNWLFQAFVDGIYRVSAEDLYRHLSSIATRGAVVGRQWSETTVDRVAHSLLVMSRDFGLMTGASAREFTPYHLPERSFLYLLHALRDAGASPSRIVTAPDWRLFMMRPDDVERELLRLHQFKKVGYEVAGSLVALTLPSATSLEYAKAMVA